MKIKKKLGLLYRVCYYRKENDDDDEAKPQNHTANTTQQPTVQFFNNIVFAMISIRLTYLF
jgi:hypothetical protein